MRVLDTAASLSQRDLNKFFDTFRWALSWIGKIDGRKQLPKRVTYESRVSMCTTTNADSPSRATCNDKRTCCSALLREISRIPNHSVARKTHRAREAHARLPLELDPHQVRTYMECSDGGTCHMHSEYNERRSDNATSWRQNCRKTILRRSNSCGCPQDRLPNYCCSPQQQSA